MKEILADIQWQESNEKKEKSASRSTKSEKNQREASRSPSKNGSPRHQRNHTASKARMHEISRVDQDLTQ